MLLRWQLPGLESAQREKERERESNDCTPHLLEKLDDGESERSFFQRGPAASCGFGALSGGWRGEWTVHV